MTKKQAESIVGGLTKTTKMPCYSYSIPAKHCIAGSRLRKVDGSVCSHCYAYKRGNYSWPTVMRAQDRRWAILTGVVNAGKDSLAWQDFSDAMTRLLDGEECFRWHDSGDLMSLQHLELICEICLRTPTVRHRLPTKQFGFVKRYLNLYGRFPDNLIVQLSSPLIDKPINIDGTSIKKKAPNIQIATAFSNGYAAHCNDAFVCPATTTRRTCDDCRACFVPGVNSIGYILH